MPRAAAFWITGRAKGELRPQQLPPRGAEQLLVRTLRSAISKGTELQVFENRVPENQYRLMACPHMEGSFPFPVKYGYCNVGRVEEGPPEMIGKRVFTLYPHQSRFLVRADQCVELPEDVPSERAVLAASMETAVNSTWDSGIKVGDRVAVVGLGVVGGLIAYLAAAVPGTSVTGFDINSERARFAERLGIEFADQPRASLHDGAFDVVFHASASTAGLAAALRLCDREAKIVELSWYGDREVTLKLGEFFHSFRLQIVSSQVGRIPASQNSRWDHRRRLALAVSLLRDPRLDAFLSGESAFESLPQTMAALSRSPGETLCHSIVY